MRNRVASEAESEQSETATSTHPVEEAEGSGTPEDTSGHGHEAESSALSSPPSVDELFARIRGGSGSETAAKETGETAGTAESAETAEKGQPAESSTADGEDGPDPVLVARRDELLGPVAARLTRSIKRALADDQNRLLDSLRSSSATSDDALVGDEVQHVAGYAAAARGHLGEAFAAGVTFAGGDPASVATGDAVEQATAGLAHSVVSSLRRRIAEGGDDLTDRVGVAFREWRGERVERLVGDHATQAFSAAVRATAGDEHRVRWVLTAAGCSDCDDNMLAGEVAKGETFPTGHAHPPAHPGCRCLITTESG